MSVNKVQIEKVDNRVRFTFTDSSHYQYNGTAEWPINSLSMVIDESDMVTYKNAAGDIVYSIMLADLGMTKEEVEQMYGDVFVGSTGGGGITPEEVQSMIDASIQPVEDEVTIVDGDLQDHVSDTTTHTTAQEKAAWNAKADASNVYTKAQVDAALSGKADSSDVYTKTETDGLLADKLDVSAYTPTDLSQYWTSAQTEAAITTATSGKADASDLEALIDELDVKEEVIASAITSLQTNKLDASAYTPTDLSEYWTSAQTEAAITSATSGKADSSDVYTKTEADTLLAGKLDASAYTPTDLSQYWTSAQTEAAISTATSGKQNTLTAGSGISIANDVISVTGGSSVTVDPTLDSGSTNAVANSAITKAIIDNELVVSTALNQLNNSKQNILTAGSGISINNDVISVTGGSSVTVDPTLDSGSTNPVANSAITQAIDAKQNTLTAGSGISIANDVISVTGGGGSVTVDPALDSGSTNPVANSAITQAIDAKQDLLYNYTEDIHEAKITFEADGLTTGETTFNDSGIDVYGVYDDGVNKYEGALTVSRASTQLYYDNYSYADNSSLQTGNFEFSSIVNGLQVEVSDENDQTVFRVEPSGATINDEAIVTDSRLDGLSLKQCTQAEYSAMEQAGTLDSSTLYIISNVVNP